MEFYSGNLKSTRKLAAKLALSVVGRAQKRAVVLALEGNLGAGKTAFTQGFARALGVKEKVLSPTFVLLKIYKIGQVSGVKGQVLRHLVHIDCYRLDFAKDLLHLGFKNLLRDKDAVIIIEWADRVRKILPKNTLWIKFRHGKKISERIIKIKDLK